MIQRQMATNLLTSNQGMWPQLRYLVYATVIMNTQWTRAIIGKLFDHFPKKACLLIPYRVSVGLLLPGSTNSPARRQERPTIDPNAAMSSKLNVLPPPLGRKDSAYRSLQRFSSDADDGGTLREAVHQLRDIVVLHPFFADFTY